MEDKKIFNEIVNKKSQFKIYPINTELKNYNKYIVPHLERQNAKKCIISSDELYKEISKLYHCTTAYDHITFSQRANKFTGDNNLKNRIKRWWDEKYVITENNKYEMLNYMFSAILIILTIFLIYYSNYRYKLKLLPVEILNTQKLTEEQEKNIKHYNDIQFGTDIVKGISILYITGLTLRRIYKRTTL